VADVGVAVAGQLFDAADADLEWCDGVHPVALLTNGQSSTTSLVQCDEQDPNHRQGTGQRWRSEKTHGQ